MKWKGWDNPDDNTWEPVEHLECKWWTNFIGCFLGPDLIQAYEDTHGGSTEVFILFTSFAHEFGYMCRTLTSHMNVCEGVKTIIKIMVTPFLFGMLPEISVIFNHEHNP